MNTLVKPIIALPLAVTLLCAGLCQTARAQSFISGSSILGPYVTPVVGYAANPQEYLTVYWSVLDVSGLYTYSYMVFNPTGDVLMNKDGTLQAGSEIVDSFQVSFNGSAPGAVVGGPSGGLVAVNTGVNGLSWFLYPYISAGSISAALSFTSDFPPTLGVAQAEDSAPPSPWSSLNDQGALVPVPNTITVVPEPATMTLFSMTGLLLLPFRSTLRRIIQKKEKSSR
jgi:hypothetical protein